MTPIQKNAYKDRYYNKYECQVLYPVNNETETKTPVIIHKEKWYKKLWRMFK